MSVKFHVGFTIAADTLFDLVSKMLPIEDLHVEEIIERTPSSFDVRRLNELKPSKPPKPPKPSEPKNVKFNLAKGVNAAIVGTLADGKIHTYAELKAMLNAKGFAGSGIGSRLNKLLTYGVIAHTGPGLWRLAAKHEAGEAAA